MKVLHVVPNYYPSVGGTQLLFQGVSENMVSLYHDEVSVLTINSYYSSHSKDFRVVEKAEDVVNGVKVQRYPFYRWHLPLFRWANKLSIRVRKKGSELLHKYIAGPWSPDLVKALATADAEVIAASSCGYMYMLYPLFRHKLKHPKPFVFMGAVHFYDDERIVPITRKALQAIRQSEAYIANTAYEKQRLVKLGVEEQRIHVVGCAVDMQQFANGNGNAIRQQLGLNPDDMLMGYIGRLEANKNVQLLIDAFEKALQQNNQLHLVLAGFESTYIKQVSAVIQQNDLLKNKVHFQYNLSEQAKVNLYHALDVYVLPSSNESFGIVFLEAWSCRKPVIGMGIGAISSVVTDGVDGLLAKPGNADCLCQQMITLAGNKSLRSQMGEAGYHKTATHYTWQVVTAKYRQVYQQAIISFSSNKP
jgi:glycosyltransferase involved in cell wall biosynthesis